MEKENKIKANISKLDAEVSELKSNSEHLKARYRTAQAQGKVNSWPIKKVSFYLSNHYIK